MDRYGGFMNDGRVSNNYYSNAVASQTRGMNGGGMSAVHYHRNQMHMPATQPTCNPQRVQEKPVIYEQPRPTSREVKKMVFSHDGREWTTGICGCFEHCGSCMGAFCCPPCFACFVSEKMNENLCGPLLMCGFCVAMRTRVRDVLGIEGSLCKDCCVCCCCPCCMCAQLYREIKNNTEYQPRGPYDQ